MPIDVIKLSHRKDIYDQFNNPLKSNNQPINKAKFTYSKQANLALLVFKKNVGIFVVDTLIQEFRQLPNDNKANKVDMKAYQDT